MSKYDELVKKLKEIFQIDKPELEFGVYRILNARMTEINEYLDNRLKESVQLSLAEAHGVNFEELEKELKQKEAQYLADGLDPKTVPKVLELKRKLAEYSSGGSDHENAVFSHLLTFFSRYYSDGDFVSQRRYKGNTYAIPYAGEESLYYWANKDQYYTKSGENFSNYGFKLDDGRSVRFRLVAADVAKDNRKDNDKERKFALIEPHSRTCVDDEGREIQEFLQPVEVVPASEDASEKLVIRFEYKVVPKGTKQEALVTDAVAKILENPIVKSRWLDLGKREPTEKNPQRTLLEKCLSNYVSKNSADYFIHKNLGSFLKGELDFYIKNEVLHLDDLQFAGKIADVEKSLRLVQTLRAIALDLIAFLSSLEDFQKRLWLKKKFVVSTDYVLTLDRVPESLYTTIAENEKQWKQWETNGFLEESKEHFGQSSSKLVAFLKSRPSLMIDSSLFEKSFKVALLASLTDLDETLDGLLIQGDNFQALNLLQEKYRQKIKCVYIDPPYNTDASAICYKNGYKTSSWASLIQSRLELTLPLMTENGVLVAAIDDTQQRELSFLLSESFGDNLLGTICVRANPSGRPMQSGYSVSHEYLLIAGKSSDSVIGRLPPTPEQMARFNQQDEDGPFEWRNLRREGSNSDRAARRALYYPIYIKGDQLRVPKLTWDDKQELWVVEEKPEANEQIVLPDNEDGVQKTWRWEWKTVVKSARSLAVRKDRSGKDYVYYKRRPNEAGVVSVSSWFDAKYSATEHGTAVLKNLFGTSPFSYPKSIHAVIDSVYVAGANDPKAVILDYFAGSGTTAHAVISLNRQDAGKRKYILVEQGEYFDTVIKPRIEKVVYSPNWKDGKPTTVNSGVSHGFKVVKIESYEDTLNNLQLKRTNEQQSLLNMLPKKAKDSYLLRYLLDIESKASLLSTDKFGKPFNVSLKIALDSAGAYEQEIVDLVETFNFLIGLRVKEIDLHLEQGFITVVGVLPSEEKALVLWRDTEKIGYGQLEDLCKKLAINPADSEYDLVFVNGDHNIPSVLTTTEAEGSITKTLKIRQIESEFLAKMFAGEVG